MRESASSRANGSKSKQRISNSPRHGGAGGGAGGGGPFDLFGQHVTHVVIPLGIMKKICKWSSLKHGEQHFVVARVAQQPSSRAAQTGPTGRMRNANLKSPQQTDLK